MNNPTRQSALPATAALEILISDALPFGRPWHEGQNAASNATGYTKHRSRYMML